MKASSRKRRARNRIVQEWSIYRAVCSGYYRRHPQRLFRRLSRYDKLTHYELRICRAKRQGIGKASFRREGVVVSKRVIQTGLSEREGRKIELLFNAKKPNGVEINISDL